MNVNKFAVKGLIIICFCTIIREAVHVAGPELKVAQSFRKNKTAPHLASPSNMYYSSHILPSLSL